MLCLTSRTFCQKPHIKRIFRTQDKLNDISDPGHFGQSSRTQFLEISCPMSGHFGPASVCSNQILGYFWPIYGGIDIETIINWAGAQNPTKSEDLDQPVHPCSLIRDFLLTAASLGFTVTNWALSEGSDQSAWLRSLRGSSACKLKKGTCGDTTELRWRHSIFLRGCAFWFENFRRACYRIYWALA